jgi:CheY-like chemotaxis protein
MRKLQVLIIEDDSVDRFWLEYVLKMFLGDTSFSSVANGELAADFLLKRGGFPQAPTPDLIFVDLHQPVLDGKEVLRQIPEAQTLPICVVTNSDTQRTLFASEFGIHDSNCLLKPVSLECLAGSSHCQAITGCSRVTMVEIANNKLMETSLG